jgi:hypothetical protein
MCDLSGAVVAEGEEGRVCRWRSNLHLRLSQEKEEASQQKEAMSEPLTEAKAREAGK